MVRKNLFIILFLSLAFLSKAQLSYSTSDNTNTFKFTYVGSVPDSAKKTLDTVTLLFSKYIKSDYPINVKVEWNDLGDKVQASCTPTEYFKNFERAPIKDVLYPIALAEKISGKELNESWEADILLKINKNMPWYYGINSQTPQNKVDFFTIVLHELFHGIGLQTNLSIQDSIGYYIGGDPLIYDKNIFLKSNNLANIKSNTILLFKALTSDSLYIDGNFIRLKNYNEPAKIFVPKIFNSGSSICHLDNKKYPKGDKNSLLNYSKSFGEAIHSIGNIGEGIIAELGWNDFLISCNKIKDYESISTPSKILCYIDSVFDPSTLILHYSFDNFANELTCNFIKTDTTNYYRATIPTTPFEHTVSYKISVKDSSYHIPICIPTNYAGSFYSFRVGIDTIKPKIVHQEIDMISEDMDSILISANISDNIGIDSVWVKYLLNTTDTTKGKILKLKQIGSDAYQVKISIKGILKENNVFLYKIIASDKALHPNIGSTKGNSIYDYYSINVSPVSIPNVSYDNNFEDTVKSKNDFILQGFTISKPINFSSYALHTKHPYPTAVFSGKTIDLTAMLRKPITIRSKEAYLDFDEIVLVEPGESGTVYGDYEFWDYCIIEGSLDKKEWFSFENKGYKTEINEEWLSVFYSQTTADISGKLSSSAQGVESLYKPHRINLLGNKYLRKGDDVFIRFRLFSDAFQNGWGWCIDNLKIQTTEVDADENHDKDFEVFPTISHDGQFIIQNDFDKNIDAIEVYSIVGDKVKCSIERINSNRIYLTINSSNGIYFITIRDKNAIKIYKVIVSN